MAFYSFGNFKNIFWDSFYNKCASFFSKWYRMYLSKRTLIKLTYSWRDKFFVLWTMNRQAKIFLRNAYWIMKITWKHHTGSWGKIFQEKPYKVKMGRNFFVKRKKKFIEILDLHHIYYVANCLVNLFLRLL